MGHGRTSGIYRQSSIKDNLRDLLHDYDLTSFGYFGHRGQGNDTSVRVLEVDDPATAAIDFFQRIGRGGIEMALANGRGYRRDLSDGSIIVLRLSSASDGSPALSIDIERVSERCDLSSQKIHFVRRTR